MPIYLDPTSLEGQPLILHSIGDADFAVRVADHAAGRIMAKPISGGRRVWFWTLTGPSLPTDLQPSHGEAETLLTAKAALRAKFNAWMAWAKARGHPVLWRG